MKTLRMILELKTIGSVQEKNTNWKIKVKIIKVANVHKDLKY